MATQPDLSGVSLPQIAAVIAVVDYGSFTAAADILGISQPSLSRRVQSLEQVLGLPIFRAVGRTMQLTDAGRSIVPAGRRILDELASINALGASTRELATGSLRIAGLPSLIGSVLPEYVGQFHQQHPGIHLEILSVQDHEELVEAIRLGSADAAFGVSHSVPADLETRRVCHQEFSAVIPSGLGTGTELNAALLNTLTLVSLPHPTSIRKVTDEVYRSLGCTPARVITTVQRDALVPLSIASGGITMVPRIMATTAEVYGGRQLSLPEGTGRAIGVIYRRDPFQNPALSEFLHFL
ncbi:LysR family transcriptional regulator [Glutamicibacter sp. JL.03c]|uniref:LysR family transcriptional regulator n=1 Tax=Glutamicibacter sp. JL.03c TaxID=2984842 RepID=UPI0021F7F3D0|nr:LysR family transcriptional regulator [Glutamicibacter sp. JL.03c]UYQ77464.1 LysR family transcriptional regulator [Glutamicibacter sp. JL.03c]